MTTPPAPPDPRPATAVRPARPDRAPPGTLTGVPDRTGPLSTPPARRAPAQEAPVSNSRSYAELFIPESEHALAAR
ncbi:MAG TPA: hypothetical protein VFM01_17460, partial [Nakamurella sp.]|nr:hypothetical protein [Nakamurella sp.]